MKIISVVGARPNFMKVAPIHRALSALDEKETSTDRHTFIHSSGHPMDKNIEHLICHTGQHYDEKMSKIFFEDLELPKPAFYLGVG
ncbi:UDP-N-acetylglucosamine 2-epimerase, partial [Bacteroidota bacterium]